MEPEIKRGPGRPRSEIPRSEPARTERRRKRKFSAGQDKFGLPMDEIPEGLRYEFKRWSVHGLEDPFYLSNMREQGWEPVQPSRHPNWVPENYKEPYIIKDGLILMERPEELCREAEDEIRQLSRRQVADQMAQLGLTPKGTNERVKPAIQAEMMRQVAVEE